MKPTLPIFLALVVFMAAATAACSSATQQASSSSASVILAKATDSSILTQPSQIQGVWQVYSTQCTPGYMIIRNDGTYSWSCQQDGSKGVTGKYHFSNGTFVLLNGVCGAEGRYQVNGSDPAVSPRTLTFTLVKDSCDLEIQALTAQKAIWIAGQP